MLLNGALVAEIWPFQVLGYFFFEKLDIFFEKLEKLDIFGYLWVSCMYIVMDILNRIS